LISTSPSWLTTFETGIISTGTGVSVDDLLRLRVPTISTPLRVIEEGSIETLAAEKASISLSLKPIPEK
jgi:hypothetical protein